MYSLSLKKEIDAEHLLPFAGVIEEKKHVHEYKIEVKLKGEELQEEGYLIDLKELDRILDDVLEEYEGKFLNDLKKFEGKNPTAENFSRELWKDIASALDAENVETVSVRVWEGGHASASYQGDV